MNIKKVSQYSSGSVGSSKKTSAKVGGGDKQTTGSSSTDRVNLSNDYQVITQAKKMISSGEEIRTDMVSEVRSQIENNTYVVDADAVAEKMMDEIV